MATYSLACHAYSTSGVVQLPPLIGASVTPPPPRQIHLRQEQAERGQDHGRHGRGRPHALFCSPTKPGSYADITHARQLGPVTLLADGPAMEILADAGYQGLGAQTGGRVITPPHRKFKKEMVMSLAAKGLTIASCRRSCPSDRAGHIRGGR